MPQCAVISCNNTHRKTKGGSVRYHRFPGDLGTRALWIQSCGRHVQNCATARICSRHFSDTSYERDVQHELLGLPSRCRLKKGAVPDLKLPVDLFKEEEPISTTESSAFAVLLAVGLVPSGQILQKNNGGLPQDLNKMHVMEDVTEGCNNQPSSPGHADQRTEISEQGSPTEKQEEEEDQETEQTEITSIEMIVPDKHAKLEPNDPEDGSMDDLMETVENTPKRKLNSETLPAKKAKTDYISKDFFIRNKIFNEITDSMDPSNLDQIQIQSEQILLEIKTLNDLAKEKEREWNNLLHLKKMKEELLLRIQRQKQVFLLSNGLEISESDPNEDHNNGDYTQQRHRYNQRRHDKRSLLVKSLHHNLEMNGHGNKQRPVRDVQSIIADYRQRHPEAVPRRGRRIRSAMNGHGGHENAVSSSRVTPGGVINFANMALGSGSQVRQNMNHGYDNELGMLIHVMDAAASHQDGSTPSSTDSHDTANFKDMLVQLAKLSQNERQELLQNSIKPPPPPYPEVTVHPVSTTTPPTNSLLHGILTKAQSKPSDNKSTFSPTLARLLTAPDRSVAAQNQIKHTNNINNNNNNTKAANVSISDILSSSKARNEITITPVIEEYDVGQNRKSGTKMEEEEADDSVDRLVIDEGGELIDARAGEGSDGDEVPQCQGCNQKSAQFVCAGCGNQWYCSRECQVSAWDDHSEVCSG